ncbi:CIS tube protein [Sandarakinorhabdus oryzae]|uniref:CIS tube protein n=1 Tax=Sandarakinorhabdus oryzae TaxID=2675220 RepID=UPI0012E1809D|nr:peptidoglycan-binding protein [Sandarakinorhabdus oryzae]
MTAPAKLAQAQFIELDADFTAEKPGGKKIAVQFNPESLKVSFANQLVQPEGGDQSAGTSGRQFVGAGTTKLALTLWFDVTAMSQNPFDDVRRLTTEVIYFMTPSPIPGDKKKLAPPATRFSWGNFLFDGILEGLEETLEFFSPEGKPLRAQMSVTLGQQKILVSQFKGDGRLPTPGQAPLAPAREGDSLQQMAGRDGGSGRLGGGFSASASIGLSVGGSDWKAVASANGIEDPLRLKSGQLIDVAAKPPSLSLGFRRT